MMDLSLSRRAALGAGLALAAGPALAAPAKSRLILLGTAGGPTPKPNRAAPAQVIIVNGAAYVIDCGNGVARQLILAGVSLSSLKGLFLTHLHSDHAADYGNLLLLAWATALGTPVESFGPPPLVGMTSQFLALNSADISTRIADEGRVPLAGLIRPHEITGPGLVYEDANVRVTAALVEHPPMAASFAYRFDCADRSIVISGDTAPSAGLVALARGADVLVHEVMMLSALDGLVAAATNASSLREHLLASHTTTEQVGRIATEAGVKTLVLSHFVPGGAPFISDEAWRAAVSPHFSGELIVGRDLLEI